MQEIAIESATRVMDAVQQDGLTLLMTELQGPMQETCGNRLLAHVFLSLALLRL